MKEQISLRELQLLEYDVLLKFVDFCQKHDLRYTLIGGTLLGAVRHKGFIPWDDDIDVGMPRPDYNRFLELTRTEEIAENLSVISGETDEDFSLPFAKVINKNTYIVSENITHTNEGSELWIDIMPFDGVGNDYEEAKAIIEKATHYQKALGRATSVPWKMRRGEHGITGVFRCLYRQLFRIRGYKYYKNKLIEIASQFKFEESEYAAIVVSGFYGTGEIVDKNKLIAFEKKEFENALFSSMGCFHEYLSGIYGDYMQLPPEDKRVGTHDIKIVVKDNNG